ncbi:cytochrome P450 [Gigaspora margarita]|uniref:Cytochrome P450 n=1 Tax=Gigaspora margarita TaxID=4874 RepID=A0A8H4EV92_GIGMA|nr:cytochrome P450 [Gigaspora margarita]
MGIITYVGIILLLYISLYYYSYFTRPNPLPGPFPLPFIGTLIQIGSNPRKWAEKNLDDSVDIWEYHAGPFRCIVLSNAKYLEKVYITYSDSTKNLYKESKFFKRCMNGNNDTRVMASMVFNNDFPKWKRNRQFVTKILMSKKYQYGTLNSVQKIFREFEEEWDKNDVVTFDFSKWASLYKSQVSIATIIGQPLYNLSSYDSISKAANAYMAMFTVLVFMPKALGSIAMYFGFNTLKKYSIFLNGTIRSIVEKRRNELKNGSTANFNLLDLLLITNSSNDSDEYIEGEQPMDDVEIETNLAETTAASIETTASGLCFIAYNIAKNPLTLEKLRAEILKVFGSDTTTIITYEDLEKCRYIDALVKEMLRHSNPAPFNLRVLDDYESVGDCLWSPGTWFWPDHHRVMNNPNHWKEPTKFDPDRFLSEEEGGTGEFNKTCKNSYVPFGGGIRMCPGRNIALLELKLFVVLFYRKYDLDLVNKNDPIKYYYTSTNQVYDLMVRISQK